jgi:GGDEF domain-containing protein
MRAFGLGFDTDDMTASSLAQACDGWAQHLLVRAPPPDAPSSESKRRQWRSLARFVSGRRKAEQRYVTETTTTLRDAVWTFVSTLSRVLGGSNGADARIAEQLGRLREAVDSPSADDLRREVSAAVPAMEAVVRERQAAEARHSIELARRVETLSEQLDDAKREGATDPLTRAPNRKAFDEHAARVCDLAQVMGGPACVLLVDIDRFKTVNDTFGHPTGDTVLRAVAESLVRRSLDLRRAVLPKGHPDVAESCSILAQILLGQGKERAQEAFPLASEAFDVRRRVFGPSATRTLVAMHLKADALAFLGRTTESDRLHQDLLAKYESMPSSDASVLANGLAEYGDQMLRARRPDKAVELHRRALALERKSHGDDDTAVVDMRRRLGFPAETVAGRTHLVLRVQDDWYSLLVDEMLDVQTRVAIANAKSTFDYEGKTRTLVWATKKLVEIKGAIAWHSGLDVRAHEKTTDESFDWVQKVGGGAERVRVSVEYACHLPEAEKSARIQALETKFVELNDLVETMNHRTTV